MVEAGSDDRVAQRRLIERAFRWRWKPSWPESGPSLLLRHGHEPVPTIVWRRLRFFRGAVWALTVGGLGLGLAMLLALVMLLCAIGPAWATIIERLLWTREMFLLVVPSVVLLQWVIPWLARYRVREILRGARESGYRVCPECGYLLRGLADDGHCPECGITYTCDELNRVWERLA
jgi:hypothetical protein